MPKAEGHLLRNLGELILAVSFVLNGMFVISWMASREGTDGNFYFRNHGAEILLPVTRLAATVLVFIFAVQLCAMFFLVFAKFKPWKSGF